jgi:hypothetical protein
MIEIYIYIRFPWLGPSSVLPRQAAEMRKLYVEQLRTVIPSPLPRAETSGDDHQMLRLENHGRVGYKVVPPR